MVFLIVIIIVIAIFIFIAMVSHMGWVGDSAAVKVLLSSLSSPSLYQCFVTVIKHHCHCCHRHCHNKCNCHHCHYHNQCYLIVIILVIIIIIVLIIVSHRYNSCDHQNIEQMWSSSTRQPQEASVMIS